MLKIIFATYNTMNINYLLRSNDQECTELFWRKNMRQIVHRVLLHHHENVNILSSFSFFSKELGKRTQKTDEVVC